MRGYSGIGIPPAVQVIINGTAGGMTSPESRQGLTRLIEDAYVGAAMVFTDEGMNVAQLAQQAVERGSKMIIAGGGDGTINAVASALVGTETILGVLPLGTLNHFAKDLGIPPELEAAIRTLITGKVMNVDVGEVNKRIFVNNSGLGLYPAIVRLREVQQRQGTPKWPAAFSATLKALVRYRLLTIRVSVNGQQLVRTTPIVFVGNNQYAMEGLSIGTRACLDAGQLCLYIPHPKGRLRLLWFSLSALFGQQHQSDDFDVVLTEELWIESRRRHVQVSIDGEVARMAPPLHYRVRPRALRVVVPLPEQ